MTEAAPALVISEALSDLLRWLLEDNAVEVAKQVVDGPSVPSRLWRKAYVS